MGGGETDEELGGREVQTERWRERERDIRGTGRDRPQQGDELLVKWLLFSRRASQLHLSGFSYSFPQSGAKEEKKLLETLKPENRAGLMGSFRGASGQPQTVPEGLNIYCPWPQSHRKLKCIRHYLRLICVESHLLHETSLKFQGFFQPTLRTLETTFCVIVDSP